MMTSQQIRQQFLDFFMKKHGHTFVPSSLVVPHDDPTLLFANAGMNQFKPIFLGLEKRDYTRAVNTQKCIRAGGKHNDLDDVGRSRRHHTFFEMLGNWSFGDYFKEGAIKMAWELLVDVWKLDSTRLHVTVHEGDPSSGILRDDEAADIWHHIVGVPRERIHYGGKDNFWEMGETGPCGPCTEIFYDRTPDKTGGATVLSGEDPRVMEIWNNVFIQYNRNPDGSLTTLPSQHVDTGMGFERICQILQGVDDNYAIDLFKPFWDALTKLSGKQYTGLYPKTNAPDPAAEAASPQLRSDIAFRVIADHVRCLTFALTDGQVPSNDGRGYVLRRILRRAAVFAWRHLNLQEPFLFQLVSVVANTMGDAFPELKDNPERVMEIIKDEEHAFGRTLERGIGLFAATSLEALEIAAQKQQTGKSPYVAMSAGPSFGNDGSGERSYAGRVAKTIGFRHDDGSLERVQIVESDPQQFVEVCKRFNVWPEITGDVAFKLHDTYGFSIDLTQMMSIERGMSVDISGYERIMDEAREKARAGGKSGTSRLFALPPDAMAQVQKTGVTQTDDSPKFNAMPIGANVVAIWDGEKLLDVTHGSEAAGQGIAVILDKTNFYAEMGGQVGDTGELRTANAVMTIATTRVVGGYVLHVGNMIEGHLRVGDHVTATLAGVRPRTQQNHTTTHLANWALREVLGDDVQQKGSLVDPEKLRFDFSYGKGLTDEEIGRVERLVSEAIEKRMPVYAEDAPQEQALKIHGLRAVFGEKYPPMVRVVSIGVPVAELLNDPSNTKWRQHSIEFCGGTHVKNSGDAQAFAITSEESVSKGIRRIVALTGDAAKTASGVAKQVDTFVECAATATPEAMDALIAELSSETIKSAPLVARRMAQKAVAHLQAKLKSHTKSKVSGAASVDVSAVSERLLGAAPALGPGKLVVASIVGASSDQLLSVLDSLRKKIASYGIVLGSTDGEKVNFVAAVSDDLISKGLKSGDWIRETAKVAGGGGGGRPQMAQAGGKDPTKLDAALERARAFAKETVG